MNRIGELVMEDSDLIYSTKEVNHKQVAARRHRKWEVPAGVQVSIYLCAMQRDVARLLRVAAIHHGLYNGDSHLSVMSVKVLTCECCYRNSSLWRRLLPAFPILMHPGKGELQVAFQSRLPNNSGRSDMSEQHNKEPGSECGQSDSKRDIARKCHGCRSWQTSSDINRQVVPCPSRPSLWSKCRDSPSNVTVLGRLRGQDGGRR